MQTKIEPSQLASAINKYLQEYGKEVSDDLEDAIIETAKESVKELKTSGSFKGTKYKRSWGYQKDKGRLTTGATVYNKKHYQLTHLLEFGHVKQNGGRTRAFPHIAPVNDKVEKRVIDKLERKL